jgi:Enoyl-(Acyl carrier protein) reductase
MRLEGKIAIVVGAGQSPGEGLGNGRATVLRFVQEGAKVLALDRDLAAAEETAALAASSGECVPFVADVTREPTLAAAVAEALRRWGRIDEFGPIPRPLPGAVDAPRRSGCLWRPECHLFEVIRQCLEIVEFGGRSAAAPWCSGPGCRQAFSAAPPTMSLRASWVR